MTGGGKDLKNQRKSRDYQYKIFSFIKFYIKKILSEKASILSDKRIKKILAVTSHCRGAILIEFAICMPVLIILLFYVHDLIKIKRYYSQTEFVAQQMANILQNIAKTRAIKRDDIKHAAALAYLTIYPGTTMYNLQDSGSYHYFFHMPRVYIYYIKGKSDGKASTMWGCYANTYNIKFASWRSDVLSSNSSYSVINMGTNIIQSNIYPTLKVEEERSKVIIEVQLAWGSGYANSNGEKVSSAREAFGLRLVNPKPHATNTYFPAVVTFIPNSGFTEDVPQ